MLSLKASLAQAKVPVCHESNLTCNAKSSYAMLPAVKLSEYLEYKLYAGFSNIDPHFFEGFQG